MLVRHIGTFEPRSMCFSGMPSARSASSNENEQPITKATRSSRHHGVMSVGSSRSMPSFHTR